jgi:hypothetical protein
VSHCKTWPPTLMSINSGSPVTMASSASSGGTILYGVTAME